jgi:hypothetical protein
MIDVTEIEVRENKRGKNVWVITRNDDDPGVVGEITACGIPVRAELCPIGSKYTCTLVIPETRSPKE